MQIEELKLQQQPEIKKDLTQGLKDKPTRKEVKIIPQIIDGMRVRKEFENEGAKYIDSISTEYNDTWDNFEFIWRD